MITLGWKVRELFEIWRYGWPSWTPSRILQLSGSLILPETVENPFLAIFWGRVVNFHIFTWLVSSWSFNYHHHWSESSPWPTAPIMPLLYEIQQYYLCTMLLKVLVNEYTKWWHISPIKIKRYLQNLRHFGSLRSQKVNYGQPCHIFLWVLSCNSTVRTDVCSW